MTDIDEYLEQSPDKEGRFTKVGLNIDSPNCFELLKEDHLQIEIENTAEIPRDQAIEKLLEQYSPVLYDFGALSGLLKKEKESEGLLFPNGVNLTLLNELYLEAIWNLAKMVTVFSITHAVCIYTMAFFGLDSDFLITSNFKIYLFIVSPYQFIHSTHFSEIFRHILEPIILVVSFLYFRRLLKKLESRLIDEHFNNPHEGSFMVVRLKFINFKKREDLEKAVDHLIGRETNCRGIIVKDYKMIETNYNEYCESLLLLKELKRKTPNFKFYIKKYQKKVISLKSKVLDAMKEIEEDKEELAQPYGLVCFESYIDAYELINTINLKTKDINKCGFNEKTEALYAPEPHDINWDRFGKNYLGKSKVIFNLMRIIFFVILPYVTYFIEYEFSVFIAKFLLNFDIIKAKKKASSFDGNDILEKTYTFMFVRVMASTVYSLICTTVIDYYFKNAHYKTHSARDRSKLQFFNIYYLLNQIVADFYGIIRAGINNLGKEKGDIILLKYNYYIFSAALKVGLSLMLIPFFEKVLSFLPKWYYKFKSNIPYFSRKNLNIDKVRAELPVKHDIGVMISMVLQGIFYMSFFSSFMMPVLNFIVLAGIGVFYYMERWTLVNYHYNYISLNFNIIQKIYYLAFFGFMITRVFSIGNSDFIVDYFDFITLKNLSGLISKVLDYSVLIVLLVFAGITCYTHRFTAFKHRILDNLVKMSQQDDSNTIAHSFKYMENFYVSRNPEEKLKRGEYEMLDNERDADLFELQN